jgi:tape measure domain-containing protein
MAVEIATAYVNIVPSARGFGRALSSEASAAGSAAGAEASSGFGSSFLPGLAGIAKLGGAALVGLGAAAAGYGLKIASENEQAQISFETMLGSGEKAQVFLDQLHDFAAKTPFEFPELQKASSSLIAAGFATEKIIPIMTTLGNVTSGVGTGSEGVRRATIALQQMSAAGKITAQDLNQLRDAGVPVMELLSAATGKTKEEVAALASSGGLGRKEMEALFKALESGKGLERFNGLMEKQSQSLKGLLSTFKDVLGQGLGAVMKPVIPVLKTALADMAKILEPILKTVGPMLAGFVTKLVETFARLAPVFAPMLEAFMAVANAMLDVVLPVFEAVAPVLTEVVDIFSGALIMALQGIAPVVLDLVKAFLPLVPVLAKLTGTMFVIFITLVGGLVKALTPLVAIIAQGLADSLTQLTPLWLDLATALLPLFPMLTELFKALGPLLTLFLTFQTRLFLRFGPALVPIVTKLVDMANVLMVKIIPALERALGWVTRFFDAILNDDPKSMENLGTEIGAFVQEAADKIGPYFRAGLDILFGEFKKWWDETAWPWIDQKSKEISDWLSKWVKEQTDKIPGMLTDVLATVMSWFGDQLVGLIGGKDFWLGFANSFVDATNAIRTTWNNLKFGEIKAGDHVIFEGFSTPQMDMIKHFDHFAQGGRPPTGRPSLVGELGPELFIPDSAGTVVPNNKAMGGFNVEHLEVHGQDQPKETAFAIRSELHWLSMVAGGT